MKKRTFINGLVITITAFVLYLSCTNSNEVVPEDVSDEQPLAYVGSATCQGCHTEAFDKWEESHHYHAMEVPNSKSVLGDFNNTTFEADGLKNEFFISGNDYMVAVENNGQRDTFKIKYTFGYTPLQNYLVETEGGKIQTLRATWDTEKGIWYNQFPGEVFDKNDWFYFTNQSANWNGMCASCHSTDVSKNFDPSSQTYNTTFSEITVGCESCHGKGSKHVSIAEAGGYNSANSGFEKIGKSNVEFVDMCGACHSRRGQYYENVQPGADYHEAYNIAWLSDRNYHVDGQIDDEDYVLGSFLSSKMYKHKVNCADCHDVHTTKLKLQGNALCMQCHEPEYNSKKHHFHELNTESANCVSCHMTGKHYMGNDFRRDHSFRIPRPDQSAKYGTPNACTGCHGDKSDEWAAKQVETWYGPDRAPHFSDQLLSGWVDGNLNDLVALANDDSAAAIVRGTAIYYLSQSNLPMVNENLARWMSSKEVLVRKAAQQAIRDFPKEQRLSYSVPALKDKNRGVRIEAVINLIDAEDQISGAYRKDYSKAMEEYIAYMNYSSDFPEGQTQWAQYHYGKGNYRAAIAAFKMALKIDSLRGEPRLNLAVTYNMMGDNENSLKQLNKLETIEPSDRMYYLRGLLLAELKRSDEAVLDIEKAIKLNPNNSSYYYNLVLIYNEMGKISRARLWLEEGLHNFPDDQRLASLRVYFP